MKKMVFLMIMLSVYFFAYGEKVTLSDMSVLKCKIVGKQGDSLFVKLDNCIYSLNIKDIIEIGSRWGKISDKRLKEKDWGINKAIPYQLISISNDVNKKKIEQMTEREYQLYLTQIKAKAEKEGSDKISGTIWKVFAANTLIMIVAVLVLANN